MGYTRAIETSQIWPHPSIELRKPSWTGWTCQGDPFILALILCPLKYVLIPCLLFAFFYVVILTESKEGRPSPYGKPRVVGKGVSRIEVPEAFRFVYHGKSLPTGGGRCLDCLIKSFWNLFGGVRTINQLVVIRGLLS